MMGYKGCHLNDQVIVKKFELVVAQCLEQGPASLKTERSWDFLHHRFLTFSHKMECP